MRPAKRLVRIHGQSVLAPSVLFLLQIVVVAGVAVEVVTVRFAAWLILALVLHVAGQALAGD